MSDLAATNCGCVCDNDCGNRMGFSNNSWIWILILLFGCGGCDNNDNNCCWIIILLLLFCGCGNNGFFGNNGCGC